MKVAVHDSLAFCSQSTAGQHITVATHGEVDPVTMGGKIPRKQLPTVPFKGILPKIGKPTYIFLEVSIISQ